jgi:hypothetical protein
VPTDLREVVGVDLGEELAPSLRGRRDDAVVRSGEGPQQRPAREEQRVRVLLALHCAHHAAVGDAGHVLDGLVERGRARSGQIVERLALDAQPRPVRCSETPSKYSRRSPSRSMTSNPNSPCARTTGCCSSTRRRAGRRGRRARSSRRAASPSDARSAAPSARRRGAVTARNARFHGATRQPDPRRRSSPGRRIGSNPAGLSGSTRAAGRRTDSPGGSGRARSWSPGGRTRTRRLPAHPPPVYSGDLDLAR